MKRNDIKNLRRISNYQYDNIFNTHIDDDGFYYYNMYNSIHIGDSISKSAYTIHKYIQGEYWTKLADKYYGNKKLWWIILVANNITNPIKFPSPGTELKILTPEAVSSILFQILNGSSN